MGPVLTDRWMIKVHSFDDTGFLPAPTPESVLERISIAAAAQGLFPESLLHSAYLPICPLSQS